MQPINDLTWMRNLATGRVERFAFRGYRVAAVRLTASSWNPQAEYRYRLLFFPPDSHRPVLALNLELTILGSACLTMQTGTVHTRLEDAEETMSFERFKEWALRRAEFELELVS
jgi:hypothetical protein